MRARPYSLGVLAMVAMAASIARATTTNQAIGIDNMDSDWYTNEPAEWNSPTATTNGAAWIKTGSGSPVQLTQSVNTQLLMDTPGGWAIIGTTLLSVASGTAASASNGWVGSTVNDCSAYYPGLFFNGGSANYPIPGTSTTTGPSNSYEAEVYFWTGLYNTYADAYAAAEAHTPGVYVADSGQFLEAVQPYTSGPPAFPEDLLDMPAMILQQPAATPEPSTLLLLTTGLLGLLAYAWRRRR